MIKRIRIILLIASVSIMLLACEYTYLIQVNPSDAVIRVNGLDVKNPYVWKTKEKSISFAGKTTLHGSSWDLCLQVRSQANGFFTG